MTLPGPPPNPRLGRQRFLVGYLSVTVWLVAAAAALTIVLPDDVDAWPAGIAIGLLVAVPIVRIGWLAVRWVRLGDMRFALACGGLLLVMAAGALLAASS